MRNFDFFEKGPGIASPSHFVYDFQKNNISQVTLY